MYGSRGTLVLVHEPDLEDLGQTVSRTVSPNRQI